MNQPPFTSHQLLSRRRFVTGVAAGASLVASGLMTRADANNNLSGNTFNLTIGNQQVNFTGKNRIATTVNGSLPGPTLRWKEGQHVNMNVTNQLGVDSSIHWHGIILPEDMDGVPGLSFAGIRPGETFNYNFQLNQSGTYWYHSHSGFQEQTGVLGAIVIEPEGGEPFPTDRDYVIILSDWSDEKPESIYSNLKKQSDLYNWNERTLVDTWKDVQSQGVSATASERHMWNMMRMSDRDISDVNGTTYTFLMNGQTPADRWKGLFKRGEKVRLRFINAAAMTFFDIRIPGLKLKVVSADGQAIEPVTVDDFRIGVAETYDVIVEPESDAAYSIFAQDIDRSGYALGMLTPDLSLNADVPTMDPRPILSHSDMGMSMAHAGGGHSGMNHGNMASPKMNHANMDMANPKMNHANMDMANPKMNHANMADPHMNHRSPAPAGMGSTAPVIHKSSEKGPQTDMRAQMPQTQLNNPGIGLVDNGRRVLTYADLRNLYPTPDPRDPTREIQLHLTGNMQRYMWSMDGMAFVNAEPLKFNYGERLRITLVNDTMMNHPVHLHGMWSDLETGDPKRIPRKHTVIVQPGRKISYLVTADARGNWAYHCHLMYHMMGMFRVVEVS